MNFSKNIIKFESASTVAKCDSQLLSSLLTNDILNKRYILIAKSNTLFDFDAIVKGETFISYIIKSLLKNLSWRWKGT